MWLLAALLACGKAPPRGTILVSIDTLRADAVEGYGAPMGATPALAAFTAESVAFDEVYSQANETLPSHGSIFTSRLPSHVAPVDHDFTIPPGTPTLAGQMKAAGRRTGAMVASGHLARVFGLDDGFDDYQETAWWGSFQATVPMGLRWLDQAIADDAPFFLFVHGYDAHDPYVRPGVFARLATPGAPDTLGDLRYDPQFYERIYQGVYYPGFPLVRVPNGAGVPILASDLYQRLPAWAASPSVDRRPLTDTETAEIKGSYRSAVRYADYWVGVLLAELDRRGLLETTDVMIVSDHGEELLDHGFISHRHSLRGSSTRVPMLLRPSGGTPPVRVAGLRSLLDVAPTLLDAAGAPALPGAEGRSLLPCVGGACDAEPVVVSEAVADEVSVTDGTWRLVARGLRAEDPALPALLSTTRSTGEALTLELYTIADGEQVDHAADPTATATLERLRTALAAALPPGPR